MHFFGTSQQRRRRQYNDAFSSTESGSKSSNGSSWGLTNSSWGFREGETLLPAHSRARPASNSTASPIANRNNFLLGGTYYPGKDKKRRFHPRRNTLLSRLVSARHNSCIVIFCLVIFTCITVYYILIPVMNFLLNWGSLSASIPSSIHSTTTRISAPKSIVRGLELWLMHEREENDRRQHVTTKESAHSTSGKSNLESIRDASNRATEISVSLDQLRKRRHEERLALLERLEPAFFRRKEGVREREEKPVGQNQDGEHTHRILRTLSNIDNFPEQRSKCPSELAPDNIQVSLIIQTSLNRLWILKETCSRWKDPIVIVVALTQEERLLEEGIRYHWKIECPQLKMIIHHLEDSSPEQYPVNQLRNLALDAAETSHVLVVDVDFVPSVDLSSIMKNTLQSREEQFQKPSDGYREAIVVPAFDRTLNPPCTTEESCRQHLDLQSSFIPRNFDELVECLRLSQCIVFQSDNNPEGHSSTRSEDWLQQKWYYNEEQRIPRSINCIDSTRYEPYVIIRWCPQSSFSGPVSPYYDERFHGYGKNKIQHVQHLRMMGYRYLVLPEGFIVHNPHVESKVKERWNNVGQSSLHHKMDELYTQFLKELFERYYDSTISKGEVLEPCEGKS